MNSITNDVKILILTEQENIRSNLAKIVHGLGYTVIEENSLSKGLEKLEGNGSIDLVLLSETLPDVPFPESFAEIRRLKNDVPIAVMLDAPEGRQAFYALQLGSFDCLAQPFHASEIVAVINRGLSIGNKREAVEAAEEIPTEKKRGRLLPFMIIAAAFGVLALALLGWNRHRKESRFDAAETLIELPYSYPSGISGDRQKIWICDWMNQAVYGHLPKPGFPIDEVYRVGPVNPSCISFGKDYFWIIGTDKKIYKYAVREGSLRAVQSFMSPEKMTIAGLAWDGKFICFLDNVHPQILLYIPSSSLVLASNFALPAGEYSGLYWDGQSFWSAMPKEKKIVRFHIENSVIEEDLSYRSPLFSEKNLTPINVLHDGSSCWILFDNSPYVLKIPTKRMTANAK